MKRRARSKSSVFCISSWRKNKSSTYNSCFFLSKLFEINVNFKFILGSTYAIFEATNNAESINIKRTIPLTYFNLHLNGDFLFYFLHHIDIKKAELTDI